MRTILCFVLLSLLLSVPLGILLYAFAPKPPARQGATDPSQTAVYHRIIDAGAYTSPALTSVSMRKPLTDEQLQALALHEIRQLESLEIYALRDASLIHVGKLHGLKTLRLTGVPITDNGLKHLAGLRALTSVNLNSSRVQGPGLQHLAGLPCLREISLVGAPLTEPTALAELNQVEKLYLGSQATDAVFEPLSKLENLRELSVEHSKVRGIGIGKLSAVPTLRRLHLEGCALSPEGVAELAQLQQVEVIELSGAPVNDTWFEAFGKMKKLRQVRMIWAPVSRDAVQQFRQAHPRISVDVDPPSIRSFQPPPAPQGPLQRLRAWLPF